VNLADIIPVLLLVVLGFALSCGVAMAILLSRRAQRRPVPVHVSHAPSDSEHVAHASFLPTHRAGFVARPSSWLAVKSRNLEAVQSALGLHNAKPCSWLEGLAADEKLFIAPPVKGWIIVLGSGLPEPSDDVDACFCFLLEMSRKLGRVQFFHASRILHHHAWIEANHGRIVRAYAWAGRTLWTQGKRTVAEQELRLKCFDYTDPAMAFPFGLQESINANVEKVPLLAARWSLDPATIDERFLQHERGVAGEWSRRH
jgi:hypothetical protein